MLLDEFLAREAPELKLPAVARPALVHGHCHQKALGTMSGELRLLGRIDGLNVVTPDGGCCGMAGAFGYAADKYEISRAIAERALMPAVRASAPETIIVADGFACRAQIRHFCPERRPIHLAQMLNEVMGNQSG